MADHSYTTDAKEIGTTTRGDIGNEEYEYESVAGYCFPKPVCQTVPPYRYWNNSVSDHIYTTHPNEIGTTTHNQMEKDEYIIYQGVTCYVFR